MGEPMNVLVTGGAGFIGSNFIRYMVQKHLDYQISVLDKLTYAGNLNNLKGVMERIKFVKGDICDRATVEKEMKNIDVVFNFAAESHVDRSITSAEDFMRTNVLGVYVLLEAARKYNIENFIQVSTDEVYGSIEEGSFKEDDPLKPSSPYAASKAGADLLANSFVVTYGLPLVITRSTNNFGPYQHPEKLIPKLITRALQDQPLPIYGTGKNVRDWIYVLDNCRAIDLIAHKGKKRQVYNVGGGNERTNLEIARTILKKLGKPENLIEFVEDRPGHDFRYSLDFEKIKKLGWRLAADFEEKVEETADWYKENRWWWEPLVGLKSRKAPDRGTI